MISAQIHCRQVAQFGIYYWRLEMKKTEVCLVVENFSPDQTLPHVSLSALYFAVQVSQETVGGKPISLPLLPAARNILFVP